MDLNNLTIVVCTKNIGHLLDGCLGYIKKESPEAELIVVDADSHDNTREVSRKYTNIIVSDEKKGLAHARQLGVDLASHPYVAFVGPDNLVPRETLIALIDSLEKDEKLAGVQALTTFEETKNYWEWASKEIFELLINKVGETDVIGTPCIFKKDVVSRIRYDKDMTYASDDTALCMKLKEAGYTVSRINAFCFEKQDMNFKNFLGRWKFYGKGDESFYRKYSPGWTWKRKLRSLFHPFVKYAWKGSWLALQKGEIALIPALWLAAATRYYGWLKKALAG